MDDASRKALSNIEEHGCHILHVLEDDEGPRFSYSIGVEKTHGHPDAVILGLKKELAHSLLNEYAGRVSDGEVFEPGEMYSGFLEGFDVCFRLVETKYYRDYFGWGIWLNDGLDFRMLQLVYPSTSGVWPWSPEASDDFLYFQPALYAA